MTLPSTIGLFGKLPREGDYVQRGLPTEFSRPWDRWLSQAIVNSRVGLAEHWPEAYLLSPPWEFALAPGLFGGSGWAGVLVSSIDRVGRYYPLTLAVQTGTEPALLARLVAIRSLCAVLVQGALSLIDGEADLDGQLAEIGEALRRARPSLHLPLGEPLDVFTGEGAGRAIVAPRGEIAPLPPGHAGTAVVPGGSFWWHGRWGDHLPAFVVADELPPPRSFPAFLDGRWQHHGWRPDALRTVA